MTYVVSSGALNSTPTNLDHPVTLIEALLIKASATSAYRPIRPSTTDPSPQTNPNPKP